ncbi:putative transcription factor p65 homolog isoform X2 [Metopolophium dirhodum]|nr:putative transcription factor p65 homolog isoform X2 [Metopolophium dirhodum]
MDGPSSNNWRRPTTSPYIKIVEQPASKALRFRYECEGRSAGSIPGVNSSTENKTYPTIQIVGYKGRAVVVVSCVTKDGPYRSHPHNLVGRDCDKGICTIEINNESMVASFQNLGIQCVRRKDIGEALKVREEIKVHPFKIGFSHKENPTSIDLNAVRLCFQAFISGTHKGENIILEPIVSDPIYDKKAMSDLSICRLSDAAASVVGDKEIILLCEKVTKDDIQVRFFEENGGKCIWEDYGVFKASDVHKQVAIWFKTPKYKTTEIDNPVNVWIQLKRPSDGICSDALPFTFTPDYSDPAMLKRKRQKLSSESELLNKLQSNPIIQSSNCTVGMVDQLLSISEPITEYPETSPNPYSGLYPNSSVLQNENQFPNVNSTSLYGPTTLLSTNNRQLTGIQNFAYTITNVCPTVNNNDPTPQNNYAPPTTTPLPYPAESNNESDLTETSFSCLDYNDFRTLFGESNQNIEAQDNINVSDSFDRIADNSLKEFFQSSNCTVGMVDKLSISEPITEYPETSPNPYSGLYSNSSVLQHENQFPNVNSTSLYGPTTLLSTNNRQLTGIQNCAYTITNVCPTVNNNDPTPQNNYAPPTKTPLPYPAESNNESDLTETSSSCLDYNDLRTLFGDSNQKIEAQDNINVSDSFDRIADNTLKEFYEFYTNCN